jgi:hypothetical protein
MEGVKLSRVERTLEKNIHERLQENTNQGYKIKRKKKHISPAQQQKIIVPAGRIPFSRPTFFFRAELVNTRHLAVSVI